jgi:hypothetical protein
MALQKAHPNSFGHKTYEATERYVNDHMSAAYLFNERRPEGLDFSSFDSTRIAQFHDILKNRPEKTELPRFLAELGSIRGNFLLDFASYRDLQRHRALTQRMPLLTFEHGFHPWYLRELPADILPNVHEKLASLRERSLALGLTPEELQYLIPMGYQVTCSITGHLPAWVYMLELRSTQFVHPTLQFVARELGAILRQALGGEYPMYIDHPYGEFDIRRGGHDIVLK